MAHSMAKGKRTMNFDTVREIALALPSVEEGTAYGSPAFKVGGQLLACIPVHRSAEPGSVAVRVSIEDRGELLATDPEVYYITDHYAGHDAVLIRLARIKLEALRGLLRMAHKFVSGKPKRASSPRKQTKRRTIPRKGAW